MIFLGALVLGVTVCSQSFGFELLDRMMGKGCCGSCTEPGCGAGGGLCGEPGCGAGNGCAEPACGAGNGCADPACDAGAGCCEPACGAAAGCCGVRKKCTPIRDLLAALKARHARKSCCGTGCCGGEPDCSAGNGCCEPGCGAGNGCVDPACGASTVAPTPDASAKLSSKAVVAVAVAK
jgi:hypothetical protein